MTDQQILALVFALPLAHFYLTVACQYFIRTLGG